MKGGIYEQREMEIHHSDGHRDFDRYRHHAGSNRVHGSDVNKEVTEIIR